MVWEEGAESDAAEELRRKVGGPESSDEEALDGDCAGTPDRRPATVLEGTLSGFEGAAPGAEPVFVG